MVSPDQSEEGHIGFSVDPGHQLGVTVLYPPVS